MEAVHILPSSTLLRDCRQQQASYRQVVAPDFVWVHDDGTLRYVASVEIQHDVREEEDVLDNVEDEPAYARAMSR